MITTAAIKKFELLAKVNAQCELARATERDLERRLELARIQVRTMEATASRLMSDEGVAAISRACKRKADCLATVASATPPVEGQHALC